MSSAKILQNLLRFTRVNTWRPTTRVSCRILGRNTAVHIQGLPNVQTISGLTQFTTHFHSGVRRLAFDETETREEFCITFSDLKNGVDNDKVQVIDVRRPDEVEEGHIPAKRFIHIPVQDVAEALQMSDHAFKNQYGVEKPSKEASDIVFHCKLGGRSTFALRIAQNLGYSKARHYPGGWSEWSQKTS